MTNELVTYVATQKTYNDELQLLLNSGQAYIAGAAQGILDKMVHAQHAAQAVADESYTTSGYLHVAETDPSNGNPTPYDHSGSAVIGGPDTFPAVDAPVEQPPNYPYPSYVPPAAQ